MLKQSFGKTAATLLAVWTLAGCDDGGRAATQAAVPAAEPVPLASTASNSDAPGGRLVYNPRADEMLFVFDELGTALTIPHLWQEGDVSIEKLVMAGDGNPERAYGARFHPVHEKPQSYYHVALIRVYDEARWKTLRDADHAGEIELGHIDGKVYSYAIVPANPLPDGTAESKRFEQLMISAKDAPGQLAIRKAS
jgi:hypothetical protein